MSIIRETDRFLPPRPAPVYIYICLIPISIIFPTLDLYSDRADSDLAHIIFYIGVTPLTSVELLLIYPSVREESGPHFLQRAPLVCLRPSHPMESDHVSGRALVLTVPRGLALGLRGEFCMNCFIILFVLISKAETPLRILSYWAG